DGIRYRNVTGVQTCALPISVRASNVCSEVVLDEPLRVYLPKGHRLEAYSLIPPARLNRLPMIAVDRSYGRSMHDVLARYLAHHKIGRASCRDSGGTQLMARS